MADHSEVSPDTLAVALTDRGIAVEYTDGREVFYHGVPTAVEAPHTTAPGKDVHVLVTDADGTRGVLVYVNERKSGDDILDESGVGRVLVGSEEEAMVFPGVTVEGGQYRVTVQVDHAAVDGRVFVFEEDQFEQRSFEIVEE
jgi:hypothetical protein